MSQPIRVVVGDELFEYGPPTTMGQMNQILARLGQASASTQLQLNAVDRDMRKSNRYSRGTRGGIGGGLRSLLLGGGAALALGVGGTRTATSLIPADGTAAPATGSGSSADQSLARYFAAVNLADGGTHYFGLMQTATDGNSSGVYIENSRAVKVLDFATSAALDAATTLAVTAWWAAAPTGPWTQIGNQGAAATPSTALQLSTNVNADGSAYVIPAKSFVRYRGVATGNIGALDYAFQLR